MTASSCDWYPDEPSFLTAIAEIRAKAAEKGLSIDSKVIRIEIIERIQNYAILRQDKGTNYLKGKVRSKRVQELSHAIRHLADEYDALLSEPGYIEPLIAALDRDDSEHYRADAENSVRELLSHLRTHAEWIKGAVDVCHVPKQGRPAGEALERGLMSALADVFEDHTGSNVAANNPSDGIHSEDRRTGAFVRFAEAIVADSEVLRDTNVNWRRKLLDAVDDRRKLRNEDDDEVGRAARASRRQCLMLRLSSVPGE